MQRFKLVEGLPHTRLIFFSRTSFAKFSFIREKFDSVSAISVFKLRIITSGTQWEKLGGGKKMKRRGGGGGGEARCGDNYLQLVS